MIYDVAKRQTLLFLIQESILTYSDCCECSIDKKMIDKYGSNACNDRIEIILNLVGFPQVQTDERSWRDDIIDEYFALIEDGTTANVILEKLYTWKNELNT